MLHRILVGLALGVILAPPGARAQAAADSAKVETQDTVRRSRIRFRAYPGPWRFDHRFPRSFMVEPRLRVGPRMSMAPRIRWRPMPPAQFDMQGLRPPFDRFEYRHRIRAADFPGWVGRERGRYRTI